MANSRKLTCGSRGIARVATAPSGEERGGPPGEDAGAEQGDAEEEAAGQVETPSRLMRGPIRPMSPVGVATGDGHGEDVGDVAG